MSRRNSISAAALCVFCFCLLIALTTGAAEKRILVFTKTKGFRHSSIPLGVEAIRAMGAANNFIADTTSDAANFNLKNLKRYAAVVFLNTTGLSTALFSEPQKEAFTAYIKQGGGYVGVHAATDCGYDWPWYGNLSGAYFGSHPEQQTAKLEVTDKKHIATSHLPENWARKDEWYNFKWVANGLNILVKIDETSYKPRDGAMGTNHPVAWWHKFDGGRAFYTAMGHTDESYKEEAFLKHLLGGIKYAAGIKK